MDLLPIIVAFGLFVVIHPAFRRFIAGQLPPFGARLYGVLMVLHLTLLLLYVLIVVLQVVPTSAYLKWYVHFADGEYNPAAVFSSLQFALVGFIALVIARLGTFPSRGQRLYWLWVAAMFVFLALDEYFRLHERTSDLWIPIYVVIGGLFVVATALLYRRRDLDVALLMIGGMGLSATGSVILEKMQDYQCWRRLPDGLCFHLGTLEEALENFGVLFVLLGILIYAHRHLVNFPSRRVRRGLVRGGMTWASVLLVGFWFSAPLEARLLATPLRIDYPDKDLHIISYRVTTPDIHAGETLRLEVFWKSRFSVPEHDGMTANLVNPQTGEVVASADAGFTAKNLDRETPAVAYVWMPGRVHVTKLALALPDNIPAADYVLTFTAWEEGQPGEMLDIAATDHELLDSDTVLVSRLSVLSTRD